jgi:signal transduction histidine kinase
MEQGLRASNDRLKRVLAGSEVSLQESVTKNETLVELAQFKDEATELLVHDLKNPLAIIMSNYEYILEGFDGPSDCREALQDSQNAGLRMVRLMANLLDVKRFESGLLKVLPRAMRLGDILRPIVDQRRIISRSRDVTVELTGVVDVALRVDDDLITRAVENIFDNALRYTPHGGGIVVDVAEGASGIEIRIGNSGPPVPAELREAIFDKNRQNGVNGRMNLGLGLYFCRLAIEANGGVIWVEESERMPVMFCIRLPYPAASMALQPSLSGVALPA